MKIFNFIILICCCFLFKAQGDSPAIISIMNSKELRIIDQRNNNSEIERFQVSIYQNPRKCANGSLTFALKINFRNFSEEIRFNNEVIKNSSNGKVFFLSIPKNELKNEIFFKEIHLKSDNSNYKLDNIKIKIEPKIEVSANQKRISFGKIYHNGTRLVSETSPEVTIRYSVLKDAICEVTSKNNFRLKNENHYISYSIINSHDRRELTRNGQRLNLPSDKYEFTVNFRINDTKRSPIAGNYSDKITFSIKTQL